MKLIIKLILQKILGLRNFIYCASFRAIRSSSGRHGQKLIILLLPLFTYRQWIVEHELWTACEPLVWPAVKSERPCIIWRMIDCRIELHVFLFQNNYQTSRIEKSKAIWWLSVLVSSFSSSSGLKNRRDSLTWPFYLSSDKSWFEIRLRLHHAPIGLKMRWKTPSFSASRFLMFSTTKYFFKRSSEQEYRCSRIGQTKGNN